jgi:transposase
MAIPYGYGYSPAPRRACSCLPSAPRRSLCACSAYRHYDWRLRCLAHLMRKARGLQESVDAEANGFGKKPIEVLETLMAAVYAAREGPPEVPLRKQHAELLHEFLAFCIRHCDAEHRKTRELACELLNDWDTYWVDWDTYWVVLDYPWLPLTNNEAERALRHWVIARRISYGTRTAQGSRAFALTISVIETCRKRGASPWPYLAEVIRQRRRGLPAPPLPQPAA